MLIALGGVAFIVFVVLIAVPVSGSHGEMVRYATPVDDGGRDVSELPSDCQTLVRRLVAGENVSREFYEIRVGETTHVIHSTDFSDRPVVSGRGIGRPVELTSWHGRRLADWQFQEDYCAELVYGDYRLDEETYLIGGPGGEFNWFSLRDARLPVLGTGVFLMWTGHILREI